MASTASSGWVAGTTSCSTWRLQKAGSSMNDGFVGTENPFVARHSADGFAELNSRPQPTERGMAPETRQRVEEVRRRLGVDEFGVDLRAVDMEAPRRPGAVTIDAVDETDTGDRVGQDDTDHIDD